MTAGLHCYMHLALQSLNACVGIIHTAYRHRLGALIPEKRVLMDHLSVVLLDMCYCVCFHNTVQKCSRLARLPGPQCFFEA
jgi:hypothetical protein